MRLMMFRVAPQFATWLVLACLALSRTAYADAVTVVEGVEIVNGNREEAIFFYANNWQKFREEALRLGYLDSYELIVSDEGRDPKVEIVLVTRYANPEQYEESEPRFQKIIAARTLQLMNDLKPGEFRQNVFLLIDSGKSAQE